MFWVDCVSVGGLSNGWGCDEFLFESKRLLKIRVRVAWSSLVLEQKGVLKFLELRTVLRQDTRDFKTEAKSQTEASQSQELGENWAKCIFF